MKRLLLCVCWMAGCVGTDVGNPQTDADLDLTFSVETETQTQIQALHRDGVHLTKATIVLDSVELRKECGQDEAKLTYGPFVIDLLVDTTIPLQNDGPGTYCRISFELGEQTKTETPWLLLEGTLANERAFRVEARRPETLTLNGNTNLIVDDDGTSLNLRFDVFQILAALEDEGEGELIISEDSNIPAYNAIRQDIRSSARLFKDTNRNKIVDSDERIPVALPVP